MISENRHHTERLKRKYKTYSGYDARKCRKPKCAMCSFHKGVGNSKRAVKARDLKQMDVTEWE